MDIVVWLRSLGLGKYEAAFRENEIDETVLPDLTAEDLKDLGVSNVGHRRKLLDAIAALRHDASAPGPSSDLKPAPAAPRASPEDRAEHRQVTVMFADLVGSTALSGRVDPEDLREVISSYQKCVAETVQRFDGFVAKYMGDGVLVYFGHPQAHEDDAEQAVRAGLELVAAVGDLKTHTALQTRVGIATGMVVDGDLIGSDASQEQAIVGETPNLAACLKGIAEPSSVVIDESTRKLLGNLFELEDLGAKDLQGIAGPVRAWAALRASSAEGRFEALHGTNLTALVGREEELELLLRRWSRAKTGEGQVVLLSGEAGIGKSRLTVALLERLAAEPHTCLRYFCSPQHTDSAFYPIISQMQRAAGFAHGDTAQTKLGKLDTLLAQSLTPHQDVALFADMLSLPNDRRYPPLEVDPQQRRRRTLEALTTQIKALAQQSPVLMIFEDAHWGDPTSLEALHRAVDHIRAVRVLLIVTYRPDFKPPWIGQSYVSALTIRPLTRREIDAMIERIVGNKLIPVSIRQDIIERSDGIPLFVEEMTGAMLEAGSERAGGHAEAHPLPGLVVPATLRASLMARLDRLGPAKEVAQIGAAIGREFSHALLVWVSRKPNMELNSALDRLITAGLLFREGGPPHASYRFKHALVQDAALETLLHEPRRALHARIAEILESQFAEMAENEPEVLARHFTEAGLIANAARQWGKAGQRSLDRSALTEAAEQLTRALSQIEELPSTPALRREQIELQVALIAPLIHVKGYAASETKAAAEHARRLIEQAEAIGEGPDDPQLLFSVFYSFWVANLIAFDGDVCRNLAADFLTLAEKQRATVPRMTGHRLMGTSLMCTGEIAEGRAYFDRAFALYNPMDRTLATRFGVDTGVSIFSYRSLALWMLGYPHAALADTNHALKRARELGQAATLMFAVTVTSVAHICCGNYAAAKAQLDELFDVADEKGALFWKAYGMVHQGLLFALTRNASDAVDMITSGITAYRSTAATFFVPLPLSYLARAYASLGNFDDAWRCVGEAMTAVETTKERWFEAEINRIAGETALLLPEPDPARAREYFERALAVARQQLAKSWELRAAMSLARLWRDQGKVQQARELLAPVYGWFTEGSDTRDLKEAKALLGELAL
jgi:class 3 adenylate cyclase/predicted ATPase